MLHYVKATTTDTPSEPNEHVKTVKKFAVRSSLGNTPKRQTLFNNIPGKPPTVKTPHHAFHKENKNDNSHDIKQHNKQAKKCFSHVPGIRPGGLCVSDMHDDTHIDSTLLFFCAMINPEPL